MPQLSQSVSSGFLNQHAAAVAAAAAAAAAAERDPFNLAYRVGPVLGKGGFGTVYAGVRNSDGIHVAIKQIAKSKVTEWGQVQDRSTVPLVHVVNLHRKIFFLTIDQPNVPYLLIF